MRLATLSIAIAVALGSSPALAENWVTVVDDEDFWSAVDKDSIRRGSDGLVYYTSQAGGKGDHAADCQNRVTYTLKLHVHGGIDYPNWRNDGSAVVAGSIGEDILNYVCANA